MKTIKYNDGELILNADGTMTAIGTIAHEYLFRIQRHGDFSIRQLTKLFDGVNNCTIIV